MRPFDEMKSFTDSEGMFSNQLNVTKIRSVTNDYNFAGTDFIYVDTSLMKDYTFHIICELINQVKTTFNDASNYCQIVVKTSTNLGTNENEFFRNMGKTIFNEIFGAAVLAEGTTVEQASRSLGISHDGIRGTAAIQRQIRGECGQAVEAAQAAS